MDAIRNWFSSHRYARWLYPVCLVGTAALLLAAPVVRRGYFMLYGWLILLFVIAVRPNSPVHSVSMEGWCRWRTVCTVLVALAVIAACVLPMGELPLWNGENPEQRNQYELMTEAFLEGRIDFAYGDEDTLLVLENPYDPVEREESGVSYHWDHAYYDGHYYMYFGVVPIFLAFMPYRLLTGTALTTYHATQYFVALGIVGIFVLFLLLAKVFFKKLPFSVYLLMAAAFSAMSMFYSTAEPALYCTAISCAVMLEIWSLYFFIRAVWYEKEENRQLLFAGIGAALGALVFGSRPPVGLANILVIPMLIVFLRQRKFTMKLLGKLALAASPYLVVAVALMSYNYARFDNPFEFGQAYQLTFADQTGYRIHLNLNTLLRIFNDSLDFFLDHGELSRVFPYITTNSLFANFPILLLSIFLLKFEVLEEMRKERAALFVAFLFLSVLVITAMDIVWTPFLLERYRMDIYFLMGIVCFMVVGFRHRCCTEKQRGILNLVLSLLAAMTLLFAFLLCVYTIITRYPEKMVEIGSFLHLV